MTMSIFKTFSDEEFGLNTYSNVNKTFVNFRLLKFEKETMNNFYFEQVCHLVAIRNHIGLVVSFGQKLKSLEQFESFMPLDIQQRSSVWLSD